MSTVHAIGNVALIQPGVELYSRTRGRGGVDDNGDQLEPLGGIVVEIVEDIDRETAEICRAFRTIDSHGWRGIDIELIAEAEVNRDTVVAVGPARIRRTIRALCRAVAFGFAKNWHKERTGDITPTDAEYVRWAHVLVALLFPGRVA